MKKESILSAFYSMTPGVSRALVKKSADTQFSKGYLASSVLDAVYTSWLESSLCVRNWPWLWWEFYTIDIDKYWKSFITFFPRDAAC